MVMRALADERAWGCPLAGHHRLIVSKRERTNGALPFPALSDLLLAAIRTVPSTIVVCVRNFARKTT